jgi:hypothetical protein
MYLEQTKGAEAKQKVQEAYTLSKSDDDHITMGRAKVLECIIEDSEYEDGFGAEPAQHADLAYTCASEAVKLAEKTENRGLRARAYLAMGFTLLNAEKNPEKARDYLERAQRVIDQGGLEFLSEDLQRLRAKLANKKIISVELSEWLRTPEGKSFGQLEDLIYQVVWEHVGGTIKKVAKNLDVDHYTARSHLVRAGCLRPKKRIQ